jgi:protein-S-isoprenylcysteine O-methyltransferase Ste14
MRPFSWVYLVIALIVVYPGIQLLKKYRRRHNKSDLVPVITAIVVFVLLIFASIYPAYKWIHNQFTAIAFGIALVVLVAVGALFPQLKRFFNKSKEKKKHKKR